MGTTPTLRLYNTLTRTKEEFSPIDPNNVRMYVCGPTVYDYAHIGNARPVIVFDLLFRLLRHVYGAEHVTYVRNITDVDDKINARALRDFPDLPLNEAIRRVTETTAQQYFKDVAALGTLPPTHQPRATENIVEMQAIISALLERGHAYVAEGEVLFDTASMPDYGQLSGRNLEDNVAGARIAVSDHKKNPADFVLWKLSSPEEPGWDSPWGRGRPGWHIECSAMSERYLGPVFDIHAGGLDLIFPHHENEIAQSRCAHGTHAMANYWMHNGFLQVEGQKMSKSLGNFITIHELLETERVSSRPWQGSIVKWAMLQTHYREPIDFSYRRLSEAASELNDFAMTVEDSAELRESIELESEGGGPTPSAEIIEALADDLNGSEVATTLRRQKKSGERRSLIHDCWFLGLWQPSRVGLLTSAIAAVGGVSKPELAKFGLLLKVAMCNRNDAVVRQLTDDLTSQGIAYDLDSQSELTFRPVAGLEGFDQRLAEAVAARLAALNARDFARADQIRNDLLAQGIQLMDYKDEAGQRQTKWEVKR